ncbi:serine hydrolase [Glycomyces albus]
MRTEDLLAGIRRLEAERGFSGTVLITRAGRTEFEARVGLADRASGVRIGERTRFGLGSVTKAFTAVAVLSLVAEGAMGLDAPVARILGAERRPATLREDVAVRHLLAHTSGIADYFEEATATAAWVEEFAALWRDRPVYRMLEPSDFLGLFGDLPPYRAPGERFQYSNAGYILLGLVIEEVSGSAYPEAVAERVFGPAGMGGSGFFAADEVHPDIATGYLPPRGPGRPWRTNVFAAPAVGGPDGGAFATAADLDRYLSAYAHGDLVGRPLLDEALKPHGRIGDDSAMGLGVYLLGTGPGRAIGAEGPTPERRR